MAIKYIIDQKNLSESVTLYKQWKNKLNRKLSQYILSPRVDLSIVFKDFRAPLKTGFFLR